MFKKILVTGGAGFIGSHIVDALIKRGYKVRVFDSLDEQVHGKKRQKPVYLNPKAEFVLGDVTKKSALAAAIKDCDVIYHEAAKVGVGQSMYKIVPYTFTNTLGTANLLQILVDNKHKIKKLIVASSMSIYGEGAYKCKSCGRVTPNLRSSKQLEAGDWEMRCPHCRKAVSSCPTDENKPLFPTSIYAINKRDQEEMCLATGIAYKIPTVALRYFNVYGPRQALSNPYTGVAAIFSGCILSGNAPLIFEDGLQSRDFIHVSDIVQANMLALEKKEADYQVFNVGTGRKLPIIDIAKALVDKLNPQIKFNIVNKFREGDIRHCYADIGKIKKVLGFNPKVSFESGINDLTGWVSKQLAVNNITKAVSELESRGLIR